MNEKTIGNRLKKIRTVKGLNQEEIAIILESNKTSVSRYETGKAYPDIYTLKKYSDFSGVSIDYIIDTTNSKLKYTDIKIIQKLNTIDYKYIEIGLSIAEDLHNKVDTIKIFDNIIKQINAEELDRWV